MDIKLLATKLKIIILKYKYAIAILLIGLILLIIPTNNGKDQQDTTIKENETLHIESEALSNILSYVEGIGRVQVMLSVSSGEKIIYQTDQNISASGDNQKRETIIITDDQRNETGLIVRKESPTYMGAIIVCDGADIPSVKLSVTQAVSRITGLGADNICVLKMK